MFSPTEDLRHLSSEEEDNLAKSKTDLDTSPGNGTLMEEIAEGFEERRKYSYADLLKSNGTQQNEEHHQREDDEVSDDDMAEEEADSPWISVVMTKEEKIKARREWKLSVIVKLVGKSIGYHYLVHKLQTM